MDADVGDSTCLALEIGGTKLQLAIFDPNLKILARSRFGVDRASGAEGIREGIRAAAAALMAEHSPRACGVGFGGPLDHERGEIARSHQIEGWSGYPLGEWLRDLTGLPVVVENDANAAALAEATMGAGRGCPYVFYMTLGSGVGGGYVSHGRLFHAAKPGEAEIGLTLLDREGNTVESRCSGWAVDGRVRSLIDRGLIDRPSGWPMDSRGQEARILGPLLEAGNAAARELLDELSGDLAFALSHVVHLLHPQTIVLGGGLSLIGEALRGAVADKLPGLITGSFRPGPAVKLSLLGEDVVLVGAALLAREALLGTRE
jgi:glucokinase